MTTTSETECLDFGEAIRAMRILSKRVRRAGWNGRGMWLRIVGPCNDVEGNERRAYIEMSDAQGMLVPWLASQTDMLACDWEVVPESEW